MSTRTDFYPKAMAIELLRKKYPKAAKALYRIKCTPVAIESSNPQRELADYLRAAFKWEKTPQGYAYWNDIYMTYR